METVSTDYQFRQTVYVFYMRLHFQQTNKNGVCAMEVSTNRQPIPAAVVFLVAFFGLLHDGVVIARSVPLSSITGDQQPSTECIETLVEQLRAAAATVAVTEKAISSSGGVASSIIEKYVDCEAAAARRKTRLFVDKKQRNDGDDEDDDEKKQKRLELVKLINETMTALGEPSMTTNAGLLSMATEQRKSATVGAAALTTGRGSRIQKSDDEDRDGLASMSEVSAGRPRICSTVECLTRLASTTFEPCVHVAESQCSALITVLEAVLQLRQQQQQKEIRHQSVSRFVDVESKLQIEEHPLTGISQPPSVEEDIWNGRVKDNDDEEERAEEQQMKLLRHAIFARLRDLITEYELWRLEPELVKERSERSIGSLVPNGDGVRMETDWRPELDKGMRPKRLDNEEDERRRPSTDASTRRTRRAVNLANLPFKLPEKMTPETQAILEAYLAWREKNGYGKISGRWG